MAGPADVAVTVAGGLVLLTLGVCLVGVLHAAECVWEAFFGRHGTFLMYLLPRVVFGVVEPDGGSENPNGGPEAAAFEWGNTETIQPISTVVERIYDAVR